MLDLSSTANIRAGFMPGLSDGNVRPPQRARDAAASPHAAFQREMLDALDGRPRAISPKWFYDAAGSALFDDICALPEYYPTRTETALLQQHAPEIARLIGPRAEVVEFGAGSLAKVRLLLDAMDRPQRFVPIDISGEHLQAAARTLCADYAGLQVTPVVADYTQPLQLPKALADGRRVGFFPGSTLGNFTPPEALAFLRSAAGVLRGGALLIGVDLVKDPSVLHAAYNDAQGVTAAFNRNLLVRANRELGCDFDVSRFAHSAFYNAPMQRIEMHLLSLKRQTVRLAGRGFHFDEGETLHTEYSHKFTHDRLRTLARQAGFEPGPVWTDPRGWFAVHWLSVPA